MTVPIGTVISYIGPQSSLAEQAAQGWLLCDGSIVAQRDYENLYAVIQGAFGQPGPDTFTLPMLQGMFLRGVDTSGQFDPDGQERLSQVSGDVIGPVVGSRQWHQLWNHQHLWDKNFGQVSGGNGISVQLAGDPLPGGNMGTLPSTNIDGGGNETRPMNVYVYWLIYAGGSSAA
jgi:hypothetical protein